MFKEIRCFLSHSIVIQSDDQISPPPAAVPVLVLCLLDPRLFTAAGMVPTLSHPEPRATWRSSVKGFPLISRTLSLAKASRSVILSRQGRNSHRFYKCKFFRFLMKTGSCSARGKTSLNLRSGRSVCLAGKCALLLF